MVNPETLGLFVAVFGFVLGTALILARPGERRIVAILVVAGLFAALFKIWLFQQAPQWHDINPDSVTYDLNAKAFTLHWQGNPVDAYEYNLRGLKVWHEAGLHGRVWEPNDSLGYSSVIGSHEWLYSAYVGLWYWLAGASQSWAIYSNAVFAAFFPAAAFGLALMLGASRRVAFLAGSLALLDPSAGVNASWLLKNTLVGFLAMGSLWAAVWFARERGWASLPVLIILAALLGIGRYGAFFALLLAVLAVSFLLLQGREWKPAAGLGAALIGACGIFGLLYYAPQTVSAPLKAISGGVAPLWAKRGG